MNYPVRHHLEFLTDFIRDGHVWEKRLFATAYFSQAIIKHYLYISFSHYQGPLLVVAEIFLRFAVLISTSGTYRHGSKKRPMAAPVVKVNIEVQVDEP